MKGDFDGELRRRLQDACILPPDSPESPDHPDQSRLRDDIAAAGDWAQEEWLELQREYEELRLTLHDVTSPTGLEQRLLDIPLTSKQGRRLLRVSYAAVAAVLIVAVTLTIVVNWPRVTSADHSIAHVASVVATDHSARPQLTVIADDPQWAIEMLQPDAPFEIRVSAAPIAATLIGGRICSFDEGPLILTRWRSGDREISMYQFRIADFGLPPNLTRREIDTPASAEETGPCRVRLWSDGVFAYAIVLDMNTYE